jgi:glucose/arabinose dehydrogenase
MLVAVGAQGRSQAQESYPLELLPTTDGLRRPVFLTHAGDERLFIIEQVGRIWIWQDGELLTTPFLDIVSSVDSRGNEEGLLGLAFDPNYAQNGYFYLNFTASDSTTRVARFSVSAQDPNLADPRSRLELMVVEQPYDNHNGGMLAFGPDGYLYIGLGDGGSAGDPLNAGQDDSQLLGKLLRVDVSQGDQYAIPADNPFLEDPEARPELWATGLRNPWRFSFDRLTGDLYIADVGQNAIEEVNFQAADSPGGQDYGWRYFEGSYNYQNPPRDKTPFTFPVAEYQHGQHCSVTGGYVYRGETLPDLNGVYLYADYCSGVIWSLRQQDGIWQTRVWMDSNFNITSFGEDAAGEVYILSDNPAGVYRIVSGG